MGMSLSLWKLELKHLINVFPFTIQGEVDTTTVTSETSMSTNDNESITTTPTTNDEKISDDGPSPQKIPKLKSGNYIG